MCDEGQRTNCYLVLSPHHVDFGSGTLFASLGFMYLFLLSLLTSFTWILHKVIQSKFYEGATFQAKPSTNMQAISLGPVYSSKPAWLTRVENEF